MARCPDCHRDVHVGSKFCANCGKKLDRSTVDVVAAAADAAFEAALLKTMAPHIDKHFLTSVAGTTRNNEWGGSRQEAVGGCHQFTSLKLEREPDNEFDPNAVLVFVQGGDCVGYLKQTVAAEVAHDIDDNGRVYVGFVKEVTGGTGDHPNFGLNIVLARLTEEYVLAHPPKPSGAA